MNKAELVASVAEKTGFTKKDAEVAVNAFVSSVEDALVKGDKVQLIGFGTFETRERKARQGRNPRKPGEVVINGTRQVKLGHLEGVGTLMGEAGPPPKVTTVATPDGTVIEIGRASCRERV